MKEHNFCQFLLVFMTMDHTDINYIEKICCSFLVFVIIGADSKFLCKQRSFSTLDSPKQRIATSFRPAFCSEVL